MNKMLKRTFSVLILAAILLTAITVPALASGTKTLYTTGSCYMREDADKDSDAIRTIPKGKKLTAYDYEYDYRDVCWYYCRYDGDYGWVSEKNLSTKSSPTAAPESPSHKKYVRITGSCNIRSGPSLSDSKIGVADVGDYFKCTDAEYDDRDVCWYEIRYYGETGWVSSKYSKTTNSSGETPTDEPIVTPKPIDYSKFKAAEYYVRVTSSSLNMRFEPSTDSSVLASYKNGTVLYAIQTNGSWYHVLDENSNRSGYVSAKYVERVSTSVAADPETDFSDNSVVNSFQALQSACPKAILIDAPAGAQNIEYSWHYLSQKGITVAEIKFDSEGITYILRAAPCAAVSDMLDIDDVETDPEFESGDLHVVLSNDNTNVAVAHFFSEDNSTQYSLVGPSAQKGALVQTMAETLFNGLDTSASVFSFN